MGWEHQEDIKGIGVIGEAQRDTASCPVNPGGPCGIRWHACTLLLLLYTLVKNFLDTLC